MTSKFNFALCLVVIFWFGTFCIGQPCESDQPKVNLTEKYRKCLRPLQTTNFSLDGITNCTCVEGYEFDPVFGMCFKSKCEEICGRNMSCAILKHGRNYQQDFEYYCFCEHGYERVDPYYPAGCVHIDHKFTKLIQSSREDGLALPLNPFLAKKLNCSHTYVPTPTGHECRCFNGYRIDPKTGECRKFGNYVNYCKDNQILALDDFNQPICKCKPGFGGRNCEYNICNWPVRSEEERSYLKRSIESFCGMPRCRLAFDKFKCSCPEPFAKETKEGKCQLLEDCSEDQNNGKCGKDKLCKLNTMSKEKTFDCKCQIEMTDPINDEKCKPLEEKKEYCMHGYLPNPEMRSDYRQKCIKGASSLNLTFQLRFDLDAGNNSRILLGNYYDLERESIDLEKVPRNLVHDFVKYKDQTLIHTMDRVMNKEIVKRKMELIIENGFELGIFNTHLHRQCYMIPSVDFDYETFSLLRLDETLVTVSLGITCRTHTTAQLFSDSFKFQLAHNYFSSNYATLRHVGNVVKSCINCKFQDIFHY